QLSKMICLGINQRKNSLPLEGHADLFRDLETATSFKSFFGEKHLNMTKQFRAVARGQLVKKYNVALNQLQPFLRKRSRPQATPPLLLQELKDHIKMCAERFIAFVLVDALRY